MTVGRIELLTENDYAANRPKFQTQTVMTAKTSRYVEIAWKRQKHRGIKW